MEKLVYLLWKPAGDVGDAFRDRLLRGLPDGLARVGARHLVVSVVDSDVEAGAKLRLGPSPEPKDALVSFWLEAAQERGEAESLIGSLCARHAGHLVVESRPLPPPEIGPGARTPGFNLVGCIERRPDLTRAQFVAHWHGVHGEVALETQSSTAYVRNEVVRRVSGDAPDWDAIVEEGFPVEALDDPHAFYAAGDSEERYRRNLARMVDSCRAFLALDRVESHPMSEYRF